jgi:hypothetical protein
MLVTVILLETKQEMNLEKKILDWPYERDPLAAGCRLLSYCYADDQESLCYGTQRLDRIQFFSQFHRNCSSLSENTFSFNIASIATGEIVSTCS